MPAAAGLAQSKSSETSGTKSFFLLGQVRMMDEITRPENGIKPRSQATLIPQAASKPVITLKTIATQNLTFRFRARTAIKIVSRLKTIRPMKMTLTTSASDSISSKCRRALAFFLLQDV